MDDYDGIKNYNGLKYSPFEIFDNFWFIFFMGSKYKVKKDYNKDLGPFRLVWYTLKDFHSMNIFCLHYYNNSSQITH
jgi:hypothetical protein